MATTDQQALNRIQYGALENPNNGASMTTTRWDINEVINYINGRQRSFIYQTTLQMSITQQSVLSGTPFVSMDDFGGSGLSTDSVNLHRMAWLGTLVAGNPTRSREIQPSDAVMMDNLSKNWQVTTGRVEAYSVVSEATREIRFLPPVNEDGNLHAIFTSLGQTLSNTGVNFQVPDEFVQFIVWGALADMLLKEGQAHDPVRAAYCLERFHQGVELARMMVNETYDD